MITVGRTSIAAALADAGRASAARVQKDPVAGQTGEGNRATVPVRAEPRRSLEGVGQALAVLGRDGPVIVGRVELGPERAPGALRHGRG